jgi:hypothetical protein
MKKNLFFVSCCVICFTLFVVLDLGDFSSGSFARRFAHGLDAGLLLRVGVKDPFPLPLPKDCSGRF